MLPVLPTEKPMARRLPHIKNEREKLETGTQGKNNNKHSFKQGRNLERKRVQESTSK